MRWYGLVVAKNGLVVVGVYIDGKGWMRMSEVDGAGVGTIVGRNRAFRGLWNEGSGRWVYVVFWKHHFK